MIFVETLQYNNEKTVYSVKNTTIVYMAICFGLSLNHLQGQRTYAKGTVSAYCVLWDPVLLIGCTGKQ